MTLHVLPAGPLPSGAKLVRQLIRTDGSTTDLPAAVTMDEILALIGAEIVDTVALRHMGDPLHVMVVDDAGYETELVEIASGNTVLRPIRARRPVNLKATEIYHANCRPGTTHQIVGDVVIVPDHDFVEHD